METDFAMLAKEYEAQLDDAYKLEVSKDSVGCSSGYESYDTLLLRMKESVRGKFVSLKLKGDGFQSQVSEDGSPSDANHLHWEESTASDAGSEIHEELLAFRADLNIPATIQERPDEAAISARTSNQTAPTAHEMEQDFHEELSKATVLADFDERYIQAILEKRRLGTEATQGHDSQKVWQETINANPLTTLENISRAVLANRTDESENIHVASIREIEEAAVELSLEGKEYSKFMPLEVPTLDVTEEILNRL